MSESTENISEKKKLSDISLDNSGMPSSDLEITKDDIQIADSIKLPEESLSGVGVISLPSKAPSGTSVSDKPKEQMSSETPEAPGQIPEKPGYVKTDESGLGKSTEANKQTETSDISKNAEKPEDQPGNAGDAADSKTPCVKESSEKNLTLENPDGQPSVVKTEGSAEKDNTDARQAASEKPDTKPKKKGPAHAAPAEKPTPQEDADGNTGKAIKVKQSRKGMKRLLVAFFSCVGVLAVAYFVGAFIFTSHTMPNTFIDDESVAVMDSAELADYAQNRVDSFTLSVSGQGLDIDIPASQMGLTVDSQGFASKMIGSQNPWLWPIDILRDRDRTDMLSGCLFITGMQDAVSDAVDEVNMSGSHPANAYIALDEEDCVFFIVPEVPGSMLDKDLVAKEATLSAKRLESELQLDESVLVEPTILAEDPTLLEALGMANDIKDGTVTVTLGGSPVDSIGAQTIAPWIEVTDDLQVTVNPDLVKQWADSVSSKYNTVGKTRTYTRPDGKVVTVSGGTYGWRVNTDSLVQLVSSALDGAENTVEIPADQQGSGYGIDAGRDWGNRYVDVDLAEQYARFYDDAGNIIWESAIVSGAYGKNDTPTGVYFLNNKATNMMLRGPLKEDGTYEWESHVDYWMPFKGGSFGLHDASWQSAFGGSRYKQGYGSHGCVNLPPAAAASLYGMVQVGDVVVVHY